jgi:hypothetical protein
MPTPDRAGYAYVFEPGDEASLRLLAALLADDIRVRHAPRAFRAGGVTFPHGAFVVVVTRNDADVHDVVRERAAGDGRPGGLAVHSARVEAGADLGSSSVRPIPSARVALVGGDGCQRLLLRRGLAHVRRAPRLPGHPDPAGGADPGAGRFRCGGPPIGVRPPVHALREAGRDALQRWVQNGGVLVTLDAATRWLASDDGIGRLRAGRNDERADGESGAPLPASVPGAILRAEADTLSPLLAGVAHAELPVLLFGSTVYEAPADVRPGEVVLRYAAEDRLRLAGYLWPEVPARVAGTPYLWTERVGSGRVIGFAGDPNFRGMMRGHLPLFANAVFLGGTW